MYKTSEQERIKRKERYYKNQEAENKRALDYYYANREKILEKNRLKRENKVKELEKENKVKEVKNEIKIKNKPGRKPRKTDKHYVNDRDLTYELILCKGRGKISEKLHMYFFLICRNLNKRFSYDERLDRYDVIMESYYHLINRFNSVNLDRHKKTLPYISEIVKRSQADNFNRLRAKGLTGLGFKNARYVDFQ